MLVSEYHVENLLKELQGLFNISIQDSMKDINLDNALATLIFDENKKQLNIEIKTKYPFIKEVAQSIVVNFEEAFTFAKFINVFIHCDYESPFQRNGFVCEHEEHKINQETTVLDNESKTIFEHRLEKEKQVKKKLNSNFQKYNLKQAKINEDLLRKDKLNIVEDVDNLNDSDIEILIKSLQ